MIKGYIPKEQRKKILLITDDILLPSGVGTVGKELILNTAHHFNWVQLAGAINHPHKGKRFDLCQDTNNSLGINDSYVFTYPCDGYGDPALLRHIMDIEKPDALFLITDPRYFMWVFQMENEIRKKIPIVYLNIWDNYPAPLYNKPFYESCDALFAISKQTLNINKLVLGDAAKNKIIKYIPHGLSHKNYIPIEDKQAHEGFNIVKKRVLGEKEYDFVLFFNSRNIRRKKVSEIMFAWKLFLSKLSAEKANKCCLLMHTHATDEHGTDLIAIKEYLFGRNYPNVIIDEKPSTVHELNCLYNISNCQILISNAEGWGLSVTEAMLAGNPFIGNVTGGISDQMRFEDENGKWIDYDKNYFSHYNNKQGKHGEWAFPVFPTNRSVIGSIPTPYIYDDNCNFEDVAEKIFEVYNLGSEELKRRGLKAREWALGEAGFTAEKMGERVIEGMDELFSTWKPREKFELINVNEEYKERNQNHPIEC